MKAIPKLLIFALICLIAIGALAQNQNTAQDEDASSRQIVLDRFNKARPSGENVVDLMEALRRSVGGAAPETRTEKKPAKKSRKTAAGQKEMLMPIAGKKPAKEATAKKPAAKPQRKSA